MKYLLSKILTRPGLIILVIGMIVFTSFYPDLWLFCLIPLIIWMFFKWLKDKFK